MFAVPAAVSVTVTVQIDGVALGAVFALTLLPGRLRRQQPDDHVEGAALSFARCPGAPYCGHLARVAAFGRRGRSSLARSSR